MYTCMLNRQGGVIDDLIVYFMSDEWFRLVVNAATRDKDLAWLERQGERYRISIDEHADGAIIAAQGPHAREKASSLLPAQDAAVVNALVPFGVVQLDEMFVARTGYTGEDGFEITLAADQAMDFWNRLVDAGVRPCGLGARDSLRLEAGMNLYGQDMDEDQTPLTSGLRWTVAMKDDRAFIGRTAIEEQIAAGVDQKLVGLVLEGRGVLRSNQRVITEAGEGETTSGGFSPTLQKAIALARVPASAQDECEVEIRGKRMPARIVKPPFARNGKACDGILQ
jgi:aminomethyltransferase